MPRCKLCALQAVADRSNSTFIARFETGTAFVNFDQTYPGRAMLVTHEHFAGLLDLPEPLFASFMRDVRLLGAAINRAYGPHRINFLMLGDTVQHTHFHVIPRPHSSIGAPKLLAVGEYQQQTDERYGAVALEIRGALEVVRS